MSRTRPSVRQPRAAEAMQHLPVAYWLALRPHEASLADDLIAECLAVEPEALDLLMGVAEAKLTT
ncbi:MAG: hypothetical protein QOI89_3523 [Solirubrobacteraceae bacterium]|nr:hypothetical protein [Solirubrobacteraceae bacterium]